MSKDVLISSQDGTKIPATLFQTSGAKEIVLFLPALGMRKSYYTELAKNFHSFGMNFMLLEQRGHGESTESPSRNSKFGYRDYALNDVMAALDYLNWEMPQCRVHLMGHSMGGHIAMTLKALRPDLVGNIILIASGSPYHKLMNQKRSWQVVALTALAPIAIKVFGIYPGKLFGFGGTEYPQLMKDWLNLAKENKFEFYGIGRNLETAIGNMAGSVLCISLADDDMAPLKSSKSLLNRMKSSRISLKVYESATLGGPATHFGWVQNSFKVAKEVKDWIIAKDAE